MGQYFIATFLDHAGQITRAVHPCDYGSGQKLAGHTREGTPFLTAVETLLALDGGSRLVWAGDYADEEPGREANLYFLIQERQFIRFEGLIDPTENIQPNTPRPPVSPGSHTYVCNADKHEYFEKLTLPVDDRGDQRNPLPTFTAHGHGFTGPWARDRIYVTATHPDPSWMKVHSLLRP